MQVLKIILLIVTGIVVLFLLVALFVKKEYIIKREVVINKPKEAVFDYVRYLKNQDNFNKWVMADPNMSKQFNGTDGTVGFTYAWDSKNGNVGKGAEEITGITENERVNIEIRFIKPFEGIGLTEIATQSVAPEQTKVTWQMAGTSKYPMNITNLFIDKMLGTDLETSLTTLKGILEK
ncbi:SRPBCC family protein [Dyadobacter sp. CY323]|uniref:SRPBCC family protein n=1 Tax=Dyadobacter sp. CY323 TaxID=2907302 RepID=UPI001F17A376|nr:SRPBCC family protein [Dyadobacter sp. CY323]MCE6990118.1 SRPBCC family protein [Dyadobacter sp. CY323]